MTQFNTLYVECDCAVLGSDAEELRWRHKKKLGIVIDKSCDEPWTGHLSTFGRSRVTHFIGPPVAAAT